MIWCFVKGSCKRSGGDGGGGGCDPPCSNTQTCKNSECVSSGGGPGHWTDEQIKLTIYSRPYFSFMPEISKCMVEILSQNISYNDYIKIPWEERPNYVATLKDQFATCVG